MTSLISSIISPLISPILGAVVATPYCSCVVTLCLVPFRKHINYTQFFAFQAIGQTLWLIRYYYKKRQNYPSNLEKFEKEKNEKHYFGNDIGFALFMLIVAWPFLILDIFFKTRKPKKPLYSTFLRGCAKAALFASSYGIFYMADHFSLSLSFV